MKRHIEDEDTIVIFRPWIVRGGKRIYPKRGRVFPIRIKKP
jgi:hypothetical protein